MTGREVFIVFDSDVIVKESVHSAQRNLWNFLLAQGAIVYAIYLPTEPGETRRSALTTTSPALRVSRWPI